MQPLLQQLNEDLRAEGVNEMRTELAMRVNTEEMIDPTNKIMDNLQYPDLLSEPPTIEFINSDPNAPHGPTYAANAMMQTGAELNWQQYPY